jgi:hypothetical protein
MIFKPGTHGYSSLVVVIMLPILEVVLKFSDGVVSRLDELVSIILYCNILHQYKICSSFDASLIESDI